MSEPEGEKKKKVQVKIHFINWVPLPVAIMEGCWPIRSGKIIPSKTRTLSGRLLQQPKQLVQMR